MQSFYSLFCIYHIPSPQPSTVKIWWFYGIIWHSDFSVFHIGVFAPMLICSCSSMLLYSLFCISHSITTSFHFRPLSLIHTTTSLQCSVFPFVHQYFGSLRCCVYHFPFIYHLSSQSSIVDTSSLINFLTFLSPSCCVLPLVHQPSVPKDVYFYSQPTCNFLTL